MGMSLFDLDGPIAFVEGVDLNATGDTAFSTIPNGSRKYIVTRIVVCNASANLSGGSLQYGIFENALEAGEVILANGVNSATSLTAATKFVQPASAQNDTITTDTIYFHVEVANGSAATADVYLYGVAIP